MTTTIKKPNFFILGAGKSGTTSMYHYLRQHPDIFLAADKEPSFFCNIFQVISNPVDYISLFQKADNETALGEASHVYMTFPSSAKTISGFFPDAKFIVILRNPADRAFSLYKYMVYHGLEWVSNFKKALTVEEIRCKSSKFKNNCPHYYYNYLYFYSGLYWQQIERYFRYFERDKFLFLNFDDFCERPLEEISKVYSFLDVDASFQPVVDVHNRASFDIRFPWLHYQLLNRTKQYFMAMNMPYSKIIAETSYKLLLCKKEKIDPGLKSELLKRYKSDLQQVEIETGIVTSKWYEK